MGFENSSEGAGTQTGEAGAAAGESGTVPAAASTSSPGTAATDADKAKRAANAERQRQSREARKLDRAQKLEKKLAKLKGAQSSGTAASSATASPVDQPATQSDAPEGWPSNAAIAECLPGALAMVTGARDALGPTRYGVALQPRSAEVPQSDGTTKTVTVDPVETIARPLAAVLAQGGGKVTPGQALVGALAFTLGPVAFFHAVQLGGEWWERRQSRQQRAPAPAVPRQVPAVVVEAEPASPAPAEATPAPKKKQRDGSIDFEKKTA